MAFLNLFWKCTEQPPGSTLTALEKRGTNLADDTLNDVVLGLFNFFNGFLCLHEAKEEIEKKCNIKEEDRYWPIEHIKQAWEEAQKINNTSKKKKHWAYVIMLQVMKHLYYERPTQAAEQNSRTGAPTPNQIETIGAASGGQHSAFDETKDMSENPSEGKLQKEEDGTGEIVDSKKSDSETVYIKIPITKLFHNESIQKDEAAPGNSTYKLIDGYPSDTNIMKKKTYVVAYDDVTKNAKWVYEILNKSTLAETDTVNVTFGKFMQNEGYEQGHLAAAANHRWCQEAYNGTFLFSNISPQVKILNNGLWKILEKHCRDKIKTDEIRNVHVFTGPVWFSEDGSDLEDSGCGKRKKTSAKARAAKIKYDGSENTIQRNLSKVKEVPTAFFKVIIVENVDGTVEKPECYLITHDKEELEDYKKEQDCVKEQTNMEFLKCYFQKSIKEIESLSGLKFTDETFKAGEKDSIQTVTWTGENRYGESRTAEIQVRISEPHTKMILMPISDIMG